MIHRSFALVALLALTVAGCTPTPQAPDQRGTPMPAPTTTTTTTAPTPPARAVAAAAAMKGELKTALEDAMKTGGPLAAIDVCKDKAQAIAAVHSKDGLLVGRTSHKLRNPANAPRPWVQPLLDEMVKADPTTLAARTVRLEGGRVGYVEPLLTGPACLACHGEAVAPAVLASLQTIYPADTATGFKAGDLRGIVWVELTATATATATP